MLYLFSSKPATIESYLREKSIAYELVDKDRYGVFLQSYIPQEGDIGITYDFGKIIPESLFQNLFMLNIHFSLLPKYRGAVPVEAAILNGESETGITVQKVAKNMDAGDILFTMPVTIQKHWSAGELQAYMDSLVPEILEKVLEGSPKTWQFTQQVGEPTFCYMKLLNRENGLIAFQEKTALEIVNQIRAFNPEPLAWVRIHRSGKVSEMNLLRAEVIESPVVKPGEHQFLKKRGLAVGTREGTVLITKLVIAGSKELTGADIVALKGSIQLLSGSEGSK